MQHRLHKKGKEAEPRVVVGAIVPDAIYRLDELKSRAGWLDAAFRAAVRAGLKVYRSGKRTFLVGSDIITFVTRTKRGDR